jgi:hypothetical protein
MKIFFKKWICPVSIGQSHSCIHLQGVHFFCEKKLSFCMHLDYHGFDKIIIKNCYPLLLILWLFKQFNRTKLLFTKIDLRDVYNFVHIKEGHEWKTTFPHNVWPFQIQCYAFGSYECPYTFSIYDEWHVKRIPKKLHDHWHSWHLDIFQKPKGTWTTCMSCLQ